MIKKIFFALFTVIFIVGTYCLLHSNIGFRPDFTVAIIETGMNKLKSEIRYFDEDLNLIYVQSLSFARLGKKFMDLDEKKLMLSGGTDWIGCKYVIELDTNNGKIKKYYVDQAYNLAMTANDKYVFASYTAKDSSISRCNKRTGQIKKMSVPDVFVDCLYISDDNLLYVFGGDATNEKSNLYIIDPEELKILKTFDKFFFLIKIY